MMRLARALAQAGVASRRAAEALILSGAVSVNGKRVDSVAINVDPATDRITAHGRVVQSERHVYYAVHKPVGYISASRSTRREKLVTDLVPKSPRVYPVGRLDKDSSGLILLTNDGDLTLRLMHPRFAVSKVYEVVVDHPVTDAVRQRFMRGIRLTEGIARADAVERVSSTKVRITLHQGFNRQVRRMFGVCGYTVMSLQRIAEGSVRLGKLPVGSFRVLTRDDIAL